MVDKVAELKQRRVDIDRAIQSVKDVQEIIGRDAGGREVSLSYTKLQEAKMWIGKALEAIGNELPAKYQDKYKGDN